MHKIIVLLAGMATAIALGSRSASATININVDAIQKAVVFLYAATASGDLDRTRAPIGTGFLIGMPIKSDKSRSYRALVTARHILDPTWAKCGYENPTKIFARVNKKIDKDDHTTSVVAFVPVQLVVNGQNLWLHNADEEVDAAIVPIVLDDALMDVASIPVRDFPTEQEAASQAIGDSVMSAGLLPGLPGTLRNYPIFKFGQISNIPFESIETACTGDALAPRFRVKVWLIAANLVSGNSGSPIFHVPLGGFGISLGGSRAMLLGLHLISYAVADVGGVTPIKFVYEILQGKPFEDADLERGPQIPPASSAPPAEPVSK